VRSQVQIPLPQFCHSSRENGLPSISFHWSFSGRCDAVSRSDVHPDSAALETLEPSKKGTRGRRMDQRPAPQAPPGGRYRPVEMLRAEWVVIEPAQQTVHWVARPVTHLVNRVAHRSRSLYRYHRSTYYAKRTIEVLGFRTAAALRASVTSTAVSSDRCAQRHSDSHRPFIRVAHHVRTRMTPAQSVPQLLPAIA